MADKGNMSEAFLEHANGEKDTGQPSQTQKIATSVGRYLLQAKPSEAITDPYTDLVRPSADLASLLEKATREFETIPRTDYNQSLLVTTSAYSLRLIAVADVIPPHKPCHKWSSLR